MIIYMTLCYIYCNCNLVILCCIESFFGHETQLYKDYCVFRHMLTNINVWTRIVLLIRMVCDIVYAL